MHALVKYTDKLVFSQTILIQDIFVN